MGLLVEEHRPGTHATIWTIFWIFTCFLSSRPVSAQNQRPNLIIMLADDFGWNDIGIRNPDIHSPYIDELARTGIVLNYSYVQPICTPSRATLMSGYYPFRTGMQNFVIPLFGPFGLPLEFTLLPERLRELGYSTNMVGKWHLGSCNESYIPLNRGYDSYLGYLGGGEFYYDHSYLLSNNDSAIPSQNIPLVYDFWNQTDVAWNYRGIYSSIPFVTQVRHILETRDPDQPLFMYLAFQLTHQPQEVPYDYELWYPNIRNRFRRRFSAMVSALDNDIGQIIAMFKEYGIYNNSIILFSADNGAQVQDGGNNYPLRGSKNTIWEGGTRASAFVHSPLLNNVGYTYDGLIHVVDWYPTFVSLAGGQPDPDMDGFDVWQAITTNSDSPRTEFIYNLEYYQGNLIGAIRVGDFKLIMGPGGLPSAAIPPGNVTGRFSLGIGEPLAIRDRPNAPPYRLYNITEDPTESNNLADQNPDMVNAMLERVAEYRQQMVYSVYQPANIELYRNRSENLTYLDTNWCVAITNVTLMGNNTAS